MNEADDFIKKCIETDDTEIKDVIYLLDRFSDKIPPLVDGLDEHIYEFEDGSVVYIDGDEEKIRTYDSLNSCSSFESKGKDYSDSFFF